MITTRAPDGANKGSCVGVHGGKIENIKKNIFFIDIVIVLIIRAFSSTMKLESCRNWYVCMEIHAKALPGTVISIIDWSTPRRP